MRFLMISIVTLATLHAVSGTLFAAALPPTTGLQAWYRADNGVFTASSNVTQWNDQTGNGHHASQGTTGNQPMLTSALMPIGNSQPVITYGSTGGFDQLNMAGINQDSGTGSTVYFVVNDDADGTTLTRNWLNRSLVAGGPPYEPAIYGNGGGAGIDAGLYFDSGFHAGSPVGVTGWKIAKFSWDGSGAYSFITDFLSTQSGSTTNIPDVTSTWTNIGTGLTVPSQSTLFSVAEILIYNTALSPSEDALAMEYLEHRFFVEAPVPEPSSLMLLGFGALALLRRTRRK